MIDLYFWTTDNGYKARHMMEESGLDYQIKPVDLTKREQFDPEYLKISPHHKIPAIVDHDGPAGEKISVAFFWFSAIYNPCPTIRVLYDTVPRRYTCRKIALFQRDA